MYEFFHDDRGACRQLHPEESFADLVVSGKVLPAGEECSDLDDVVAISTGTLHDGLEIRKRLFRLPPDVVRILHDPVVVVSDLT